MRRFSFTFFLLFFLSFLSSAQQAGKISGNIKSTSQKLATEAITVALLRAGDSATVTTAVIDQNGTYSFTNLAYGRYLVAVTAVGHQKTYSPAISLTQDNGAITLPVIQLKAQAKAMQTVIVSTKKPMVEHKIDRTIVNVEASVTNVGATAMEVLEKSPGISVDRDGGISLKGKEGVMIMIDGRPTQLGSAELANLLRNMNASQLDQIEIMTNPPARYEAEGNAGVINLKTKKTRIEGFNGSVSLGYTQGKYPKTNEGITFNYRVGKVNLFTNINHGFNKNFGDLTIKRNLRNSGSNELENYFDQQTRRVNTGSSWSSRTGMDYIASSKTNFGFAFNHFANENTLDNTNQTNISDATKHLQSVTRAKLNNNSEWKNYGLNLNFRTVLDSTGRELTAEGDYITYDGTNNQLMINSYFDAAGHPLAKADSLRGILPNEVKIYSGRMDYVHPLNKGAKLEAGLKSSITRTDNNSGYDSLQFGRVIPDRNRSNHFVYEENINAAYVNMSGSLSKKVNAQLGLRMENTIMKGTQLTTGEHFNRRYTQLFPTLFLQYKANDKNNFGINYGRRIRRPNYESLNPFIRFMDRYTYTQGNPDLVPQTSHNIELSHSYKNQVTTTLNYSATNDIIQNVIEQKGQEAYSRLSNIASMRQVGISVSTNNNITKWWTSNVYLNVFYNHFKGIVNTTPISFAATRMMVNTTQQFKLTKTLTGEINGMYRTPGIEGVIQIQSMGIMSLGFSQQVLKNKGSVRLSIRDVFYTQRARGTIRYGNVDASLQEVRDSRVVSLGLSYRFSKGKATGPKKRTDGSASEEQNRIGMD
jgi:hypothetical protein